MSAKGVRQTWNLALVDLLRDYFLAHPDQRFIQGLWNLGIIRRKNIPMSMVVDIPPIQDDYNEEPAETLSRVAEAINKWTSP